MATTVSVGVNMPDYMRDTLKETALKNSRSMSSQAMLYIREGLERELGLDWKDVMERETGR